MAAVEDVGHDLGAVQLARRQALDPQATNVNRLVRGMDEMIRRTVGPAITVNAVGADELWPTLVDPNQLETRC